MLGPYPLDSIITGDARQLAQAIPDASVKLAFADPPYWVKFKYANGKTDADMDYIDPAWLVSEMLRIAPVAMITPGIGHMFSYPKPYWVINWYKPAAMGRNVSGGVNSWEPILVYGKVRIDIDVIQSQVRFQHGAEFHTCPKPLRLMTQIVERYSAPGDTVLDLFVGSGTTCVAAKILERRYLAFEIDPAIADKARARVADTLPLLDGQSNNGLHLTAAQVGLFDNEPESGTAAGEP